MAVSVLSLFLSVPCVGLQCVIVVFPIHTYLLKEISKSYSVLKAVIYVTYWHINNKKIINTRNDVDYSILLLHFNIMLIHGV